jgi:tetratricopeptide (TPR) repeat protein
MTVHSSGEPVQAVLGLLRAEEPLEQEPSQQALLRHEAGVLEELRGDESAAVREYLAAWGADGDFREPVEALVRILSRRRDTQHLPRLLESMVDVAATANESARALWELAVFRHTVENDLAQARACLEQALEADPNDAACWLELELVAAKENDTALRMRALEARAGLTADPTWQGLLLIQLAELCADADDADRASSLLDTAAAVEGRARFLSRLALERVAARAGDARLLAHALDGQAEIIAEALDDPAVADRVGVPRFMCTPAQAADAWLRAGELRRRGGDAAGAAAALGAAAERLPSHPVVARLRIAAADASGDVQSAVAIAREQIEGGLGGPAAAAMWLRLARAAEEERDAPAALEAYAKALELEPSSIVALTLQTDLLAQGEDATLLAGALERQAMLVGGDAARGRAFVTVAYVWAVRAGDVARGKQALERAAEHAVDRAFLARIERSFAALCSDDGWYEDATRRLLALVTDPRERATLCFELGKSRLGRDETAGALEAFAQLASLGEGEPGGSAWLGRALAAYAVGAGNTERPRDRALVARLAEVEPDRQLARGLAIVAAVLGAREGDIDRARALLGADHQHEPGDPVVALCLAEIERRRGDVAAAARVLQACGAATSEARVSGALHLEAGFLLWQTGDKAAAITAFEQALEPTPRAAQLALSWALRAARPDDAGARQRALDLTEGGETDGGRRANAALERFGLAALAPDGEADARAALAELEDIDAGPDVALAAALARLVWTAPGEEGARQAALERLEEMGGPAQRLARAERYQLARFVDRDVGVALRAAREWTAVEPSLLACLEWLGAAYAADDRDAEIDAREALARAIGAGTGNGELQEARAAVEASAATVRLLHHHGQGVPLLRATSPATRMLNLELAPPGAAPQKRAAALRGVGDVLGDEAKRDAARLCAWSELCAHNYQRAREIFEALAENEPADVGIWEGMRSCAEALGDWMANAQALARLGSLCRDDVRAGELWEKAGLILVEHPEALDDADIAFQRALERDRSRFVSFDKLFRRVRDRRDNERLLQLIDLRLTVTDDTAEITKMYWERARVYRDKGDADRALKCLKDVTMLEPDHVGALALAGEIAIKKGDFAEAAPLLARLATLKSAPDKQRQLSGVAAVDLYEKKLEQPEKALEVLSRLYKDGLSTTKVRERLARLAARVGRWEEAVEILERLMEERDTSRGRADAARLAMAIYRDKLQKPSRAATVVARLLQEAPDDREAIELLLRTPVSEQLKKTAVPHAKRLLLEQLVDNPFDLPKVELISEIAAYYSEPNLRRAALGVAIALGGDNDLARRSCAEIEVRSVTEPQIVLDEGALSIICDPDDIGPIAELFTVIAPAVSEALGPSLRTEDVGRKQRLDSGHPMRIEIARWIGALGIGDFEIYVGGRDSHAVKGVAGELPALVVGSAIRTPLDAAGRSAIGREVFALRRGTTAVAYQDDNTIASIVVAVCKDAGLAMQNPPYAVFGEIERVMVKAMNRKLRNAARPICQRLAGGAIHAHAWAAAARRSLDRMALIAAGDAASVIEQVLGPPSSPARQAIESDLRAKRLLSFAMSADYLELRRKLGMGAP